MGPSSGETIVFMQHLVLVCVYASLGTCYSVWMTAWYAGAYAHSCTKHVEIDKYTKNKLCTKLVLFTRQV